MPGQGNWDSRALTPRAVRGAHWTGSLGGWVEDNKICFLHPSLTPTTGTQCSRSDTQPPPLPPLLPPQTHGLWLRVWTRWELMLEKEEEP